MQAAAVSGRTDEKIKGIIVERLMSCCVKDDQAAPEVEAPRYVGAES
jgi:hypothetical protein